MMQSCINNYLQTFADESHDDYSPEVLEQEREKQLANLCHALSYSENFDIWHPIEIGVKIATLNFLGRKAEAVELAKAVLYSDIVPLHFYASSAAIKELIYEMFDEPELINNYFDVVKIVL